MIDYVKQGKRNKAMGADFERRVRKDMEEKGWVISKYVNNIDLENNKSIPAKASRFQLHGTGFPDFIAYRKTEFANDVYLVYFIECKCNGQLSKIEKEKARWYLDNNYCSKFLIASKYKEKNRVKIKYEEVK